MNRTWLTFLRRVLHNIRQNVWSWNMMNSNTIPIDSCMRDFISSLSTQYNNTQLNRRWEISTKILNFVANKNDVLCDHHFTEDSYVFPWSKKLKYEAIPTLFNFPSTSSFHTDSPRIPRKPPCKRSYPLPPETSACMVTKTPRLSCDAKPKSPSKEELNRIIEGKDQIIVELKSKVKM